MIAYAPKWRIRGKMNRLHRPPFRPVSRATTTTAACEPWGVFDIIPRLSCSSNGAKRFLRTFPPRHPRQGERQPFYCHNQIDGRSITWLLHCCNCVIVHTLENKMRFFDDKTVSE